MKNYRNTLIAAVTFLSGLYFFLEFILPEKLGELPFLSAMLPKEAYDNVAGFEFGRFHDQISFGFVAVGAMAIGLGIINILRVHGAAVLKTSRGWRNSLALLFGLVVMFVVEGGDFIYSEERVTAWKQFSDWRLYSDAIRRERLISDVEASDRIEALIHELDTIVLQAKDGEGMLAFPQEEETSEAVVGSELLKIRSPEDEPEEISGQRQFAGTTASAPPATPEPGSIEVHRRLAEQFLRSTERVEQAAVELATIYQSLDAATEAPGDPFRADMARLGAVYGGHARLEAALGEASDAAKDLSSFNYTFGSNMKWLTVLREGFFYPLGSAMFSLLAFYIATAAYRSFRVRSFEALLMMVAALLVILGQIPHGPTHIWEGLPLLRLWLLENLSTPAFRAIYFGAMIAGLAMAVRMWLSLEQSPLGAEELEQ